MSISRNEAYELIAACEQAGLSRQKTKDLLNNQGYPINSKQLVCAMSKNIKEAPDNLLVVSEQAEDRLRQSVILLKIAAETDPRAAKYLEVYQTALVETASVLKAMEELKAFVLQERKEKKALRVVGKVNLHENGKATI